MPGGGGLKRPRPRLGCSAIAEENIRLRCDVESYEKFAVYSQLRKGKYEVFYDGLIQKGFQCVYKFDVK